MAGFMAVGADDGHLSECAIFAIKKTNGTYVWPEARGPRLGLEKQPAVAAQWVARAMFVDARSHVGDPRRGSPCTVGSAGGQSITTVRQAPGGGRHRLSTTRTTTRRRTELGSHRLRWRPRTQSPSTPATRRRRPVGLLPAGRERETSDLACSVCFPRAASNRLPRKRTSLLAQARNGHFQRPLSQRN